jgi:hypothetical protein
MMEGPTYGWERIGAMDEAEREAANRMLEEENARVRKYLKRRLARRKTPTAEGLAKLQEWEKHHAQVIELIRQRREARINAESGG